MYIIFYIDKQIYLYLTFFVDNFHVHQRGFFHDDIRVEGGIFIGFMFGVSVIYCLFRWCCEETMHSIFKSSKKSTETEEVTVAHDINCEMQL